MMRYAFVCLLLTAMAWGQATSPPPPPAQQPGAAPSAAANPAASKEGDAAKVAPDAAVITIAGLCDHPPAEKAAADPNCKTVITRAEFERILDAVQPNMPAPRRRQFAMRYSMALVMAGQAHEMGLDQGPKFEDRMKLMRIQVLSQEFNQAQQEKAGQVSDQDIADYYKNHAPDFEEANLQRIFVPRAQQPGGFEGETQRRGGRKAPERLGRGHAKRSG